MKSFKLSYQDKNENELTVRVVKAENQKEADRIAEIHLCTSMINDLAFVKATEI
jgi:hypothetical protein